MVGRERVAFFSDQIAIVPSSPAPASNAREPENASDRTGRVGPPSRIANCGSDGLWIYDDPATLYRKLNPSSQKMLEDLSIERGK